ncbi:MAG: hypothetical protein MUD08_02775 [Cytophagales bacterium]|jgi:hypothetical protein|nr:hypothetical protein [Cytophagales bacterium]
MNRRTTLCGCLLVLALAGCGSLRESSKYAFKDGFYRVRPAGGRVARAYVAVAEDTIQSFPILRDGNGQTQVDTSRRVVLVLAESVPRSLPSFGFVQSSFDLDVLTIPFKYRPVSQGFPRQFNTNFNGALYLGYRSDVYRLRYRRTPLGVYRRQVRHYGFSFGVFGGLGATAVNPWVTNNQVAAEYDGVVFSKGVAAIVGIDAFTFGLGLGFDDLLDGNRRVWIYQRRPWLGLTLGLNLN